MRKYFLALLLALTSTKAAALINLSGQGCTLNGTDNMGWFPTGECPADISAVSVNSINDTSATVALTTDGVDGDLYYLLEPCANPEVGTLALMESQGTPVVISGAGGKNIPLTGLSAGTCYRANLYHKNAGLGSFPGIDQGNNLGADPYIESVTFTTTGTGGGGGGAWAYGSVASDPAIAWGYDPRTRALPADPASWTAGTPSETANNYYIDNTAGCITPTALTQYGHPGQPLCGPMDNVTWPEGSNIVVEGNGKTYDTGEDGRWQWSCAGTSANPVVIQGRGVAPEFLKRVDWGRDGPGCDHLIVDNVSWPVTGQGWDIYGLTTNSYITYRNTTINGDGLFGGGSHIGMSGPSAANPSHHVMIYNITGADIGDYQTASATDYHFIKTAAYVNDVYMIDTNLTRIQADCIQVGDASLPADGHPQRTFIFGNSCTDTGENWLDVKDANGVASAFNTADGFVNLSSSSGECVVIHDEANNVFIIGNKLSGCYRGVYVSGEGEVHVYSNEIRDLLGTVDFGSPYYEDNTGIFMNGSVNVSASYNILHNVVIGIQWVAGVSGTLEMVGNTFGARSLTAGWDLMIENTADATNSTIDGNYYADPNPKMRVGATEYAGLVAWQANAFNSAHGDNSIANSTPLFTNEAGDDFTLQASSPAVDQGFVKPAFFSTYQTIFGVTPDVDLLKAARPALAADWDLGPYESH